MAAITINGQSIDPIANPTPPPQSNNSQSNYILIQTNPSLTDKDRAELASLGVTILEYVPFYSYLCRYEKSDLQPIRSLSYISWADDYSSKFKLAPDLSTSYNADSKIVDVVLHDNVDPESLRPAIAAAARVTPDKLSLGRQKARLNIQTRYLPAVGAIDEVRRIEEFRPPEFSNNVARTILGVGALNGNGGVPFEGEGQIVVVADSGFDIGSEVNVHPAFRGQNGERRVLKLYAVGRQQTGETNDPTGHGTHVAGSVLGDGESVQFGKVRGTAPKARLIVQSLLDENNRLKSPVDLHDLFSPPYDDAQFSARIHTNSWGSNTGGEYDQQCKEVDDFIWHHRDLVVCFSAGNDGRDSKGKGDVDPGSINAPGIAKNCITVGASENDRSNFGRTYGHDFPARFKEGPLAGDNMADNKDSVAAISSRGPTTDKRIKPDLVAPGTFILSAQSRDRDPSVPMWEPGDSSFYYDGGTSMATPLVAGCVALVREFLDKVHNISQPSAALVKALLINGAQPFGKTGNAAIVLPDSEQGFGRVDMAATVGPFPQGVSVDFRDEAAPLSEQQPPVVIPVTIDPETSLLKVTLVWTDLPAGSLQNDLDLTVRTAAGEERHGNVDPAVANASKTFDRANNVEQVVWKKPPAGAMDIIVRAFRIKDFMHPQPYALVIRTEQKA